MIVSIKKDNKTLFTTNKFYLGKVVEPCSKLNFNQILLFIRKPHSITLSQQINYLSTTDN